MKTIGKIVIYLFSVLLAAWMVPWVYRLATLKPFRAPFTLYSCVVDDFVSVLPDGSDIAFEDTKGNTYVGKDADTLLPLFYYTSLIQRGIMPDSLKGRAVVASELDANRIIKSTDIKDINKRKPAVWQLMESQPERMELEDPEFVMASRRDGLHLIRMETNTEDEALTAAFASALDGFAHPVLMAAGNVTDRKSYDEGYLLSDSDGELWHLKLASGAPVARKLDFRGTKPVKLLMVTEEDNRKTLGYVVDGDDRMSMLLPDGTFVPTEVRFDPTKKDMLLVADMLNYTIKVSDNDGADFYALDADDFSLVDTLHRDYPEDTRANVCKWLFPLRLYFVSGDDSYVRARFADFSWVGLIVNALLALLWAAYAFRRGKSLLPAPFILIGGVFTLVPILLLRE